MAEIAAIQQRLPCEIWDSTTWPDYLALQGFWKQWPPLIVTSAILAGMTPKQREKAGVTPENSIEDMAALAQMIGSAPPGVSV